MSARILIVEDEESVCRFMVRALEMHGYAVTPAYNAAEGIRIACETQPHIIILDLNLPDMHGLDVLAEMKKNLPSCEVVINSAISDLDMAVKAMRAGAFDYIVKPLQLDAILLTIERVVEARNMKQENRFLREQYESQFLLDNVGVHSPAIAAVFEEASRYAPRELPVLIQGESGTGKELVARHIHARCPTKNGRTGPFIPINCGALTASLIESELFGYTGGSFTGAERKGKTGKFEAAEGGTVFLDEIGELPLEMQAKLLRFLQEKRFFPVGGTREIDVDVKVVCATNRNLAEDVADGAFRKDLFFRINVGCVTVPPLRERRSEVVPLAEQFLVEFAQTYNRNKLLLTPDAGALMEAYEWPGNVRELRNLCERMALITEGPELRASDLRELGIHSLEKQLSPQQPSVQPTSCQTAINGDCDCPCPHAESANPPGSGFTGPICSRMECMPKDGFDLEGHIDSLVTSAYELNGSNQSRTARYLNVTREVLRHRLKKLGLIGKNGK